MRLYVCGPMSGYPEFNRAAFAEAATSLRSEGYTVHNPSEWDEPDEWTWADCLKRDLALISTDVDGIAVLPNAELSRGALLELHVARELGMPCLPVDVWLWKAGSYE